MLKMPKMQTVITSMFISWQVEGQNISGKELYKKL